MKIRMFAIFRDPVHSNVRHCLATRIFDDTGTFGNIDAKLEMQTMAREKGLTNKELIKVIKRQCELPENPSN